MNTLKYTMNTLIKRTPATNAEEFARTKMITIEAAIKAITQNITPDNEAISKKAISHYTSIFEGFSRATVGEQKKEHAEAKKNLELKAIQAQKVTVQKMLEKGEISHTVAATLRKYIRFAELATLWDEFQ